MDLHCGLSREDLLNFAESFNPMNWRLAVPRSHRDLVLLVNLLRTGLE